MFFEGACSKEAAGAGVVLVSPTKEVIHLSFRLNFQVTNNIAEYEGLLQGLKKSIGMNVKNIKVFGDSQIIVDQVRKRIHCNSLHLVRYQHEVWDLIDNFYSFNIK